MPKPVLSNADLAAAARCGDSRGRGDRLRGRRGPASTWSGARFATCCSAEAAATSTWSSRATPARSPGGWAARWSSTSASRRRRPQLGGHEIDIARARSETYERPGALPDVQPGRHRRRPGASRLHDQRDGGPAGATGRRGCSIRTAAAADLEAGLLRVLHAAQLPRRPDPGAARGPLRRPLRIRPRARHRGAARGADLDDRLRRAARRPSCCGSPAEPTAPRRSPCRRLGADRARPGRGELASRVVRAARRPPWSGIDQPERRGARRGRSARRPGEAGSWRRLPRAPLGRGRGARGHDHVPSCSLARAARRRVAGRLRASAGATWSSRSTAMT